MEDFTGSRSCGIAARADKTRADERMEDVRISASPDKIGRKRAAVPTDRRIVGKIENGKQKSGSLLSLFFE